MRNMKFEKVVVALYFSSLEKFKIGNGQIKVKVNVL